jgi:hypothetical protein
MTVLEQVLLISGFTTVLFGSTAQVPPVGFTKTPTAVGVAVKFTVKLVPVANANPLDVVQVSTDAVMLQVTALLLDVTPE